SGIAAGDGSTPGGRAGSPRRSPATVAASGSRPSQPSAAVSVNGPPEHAPAPSWRQVGSSREQPPRSRSPDTDSQENGRAPPQSGRPQNPSPGNRPHLGRGRGAQRPGRQRKKRQRGPKPRPPRQSHRSSSRHQRRKRARRSQREHPRGGS